MPTTKTRDKKLVCDPTLSDARALIAPASLDAANQLSTSSDRDRKREFRLQTGLFRDIFGQSKKSPFLWSVSASHPIAYRIQDSHTAFFSKRTRLEELADRLQLIHSATDANSSYDELLNQIAIAAYGPRFESQFPSARNNPAVPADSLTDKVDLQSNLISQLQQVELPLWKMIDELSFGRPNAFAIVRKMEKLIGDLLDTDGWLQASDFSDFGLLAASWCRCNRILIYHGYEWQAETQAYLDWMCRQLIRCLRPDGSILFGEPGAGLNAKAFRTALMELTSDRGDRRLLASCLQKSVRLPKLKRKTAKFRLPAESSISEWAEVGVLQKGWCRGSPKVGMNFDGGKFQLELCQWHTWIGGNCTPTISIDDQIQDSTSEVDVNCNLRFDHADFVELQVAFGEWRLQRQVLLLRDDDLLLIGDNLVGPQSKRIEYSCSYPLGPGVIGVAETENTEVYLHRKKSHCLVLPLGLPEWKSAPSTGRLAIQDGLLTLRQTIHGRGLSAPLIFDLNPKRSLKPRTWRGLSVAEKMELVGPDIAAAYRVQIGRQQWLFYRAIAEIGNRTFMGQNFADDFFVGRISLNGAVETILEVE